MPPSYMVVDIRWDDYAEEPSEEIVQLQDPTKLVQLQDPMKEIFKHHKTPPPLSQNYNLLKTHQRLFLDDQVVTISSFPLFSIFQHSDTLLADRTAVQC